MLFVYEKKTKLLGPSEETDFKSNEILERKDIGQSVDYLLVYRLWEV